SIAGDLTAAAALPKGAAASSTGKRQGLAMTVQRSRFSQIGGALTGSRAQIGGALDRLLVKATLTASSAAAADSGSTTPQDYLLPLLDAAPTIASIYSIYDKLNAQIYAENYTLALGRMQDIQKSLSDRLNSLGTVLTTPGELEVLDQSTGLGNSWNAWTSIYGSSSTHKEDLANGDGGSSRNSFGDVTSVERRFGRLTLGFFGACGTSSTQLNLPSSRISSDSWHLGMYMSTPLTWRLFLDLTAFYGNSDNVIRRTQLDTGAESRVKTETQEWLTQIGMGAQLAAAGSRWSIVPTARLAFAVVHQAGMSEQNVGALGVNTSARWDTTMLSKMGVEVSREGRIMKQPVRVSLLGAWVHDFSAAGRNQEVRWQGAPDISWTVSNQRRSADSLRFGSSAEFTLGERRTLRLYAEQDFAEGNRVLRGGVTFTIGF
ncbi:MAG: autotransporter outer membrane beta-barrel domain-containing protein, partial [Chthoniobacteraceae bacterium]|nr:autotransporter outer membrane beta-barrel domain-containing protein [Chthoniobacteraceae bacterium]